MRYSPFWMSLFLIFCLFIFPSSLKYRENDQDLGSSSAAYSSIDSNLFDRGSNAVSVLEMMKNKFESGETNSRICKSGVAIASDMRTVIALGAMAKKGPIQIGDRLLAIDGMPYEEWLLKSSTDRRELGKVGDRIKWLVTRNGRELEYEFNCPHSRGEFMKDQLDHANIMYQLRGVECMRSAKTLMKKYGENEVNLLDYAVCSSQARAEYDAEAFYIAAISMLDYSMYDANFLATAVSEVDRTIEFLSVENYVDYAKTLTQKRDLAIKFSKSVNNARPLENSNPR